MYFYTGNGEKITIDNNGEDSTVKLKAPWDTVIHRGWVAGATENTLPAFYLAKENGYNWVECDVRFSSEGVPVLAHDTTIKSEDGTTTLTVAESTVEQLQAITLSTHSRFGTIKMPTLTELLEMARLIDLSILIDVKTTTNANAAKMAQIVLSSGWSNHVVYMPKTVGQATEVATVDKNASFDFVTYATSIPTDFTAYKNLLTGANTVCLDIGSSGIENITQEQLDSIRAAGLGVCWWGVGSTDYKSAFDACPLRVTKANGADATDLDAMYLAEKVFP